MAAINVKNGPYVDSKHQSDFPLRDILLKKIFYFRNGRFGEFCNRAISGVFCRRNPTTIFRAVVPIIVDSIKRKSILESALRRPIRKSGEILPLFRVNDTAGSIPVKPIVLWIVASGLHASPSMIKPCVTKSMLGILVNSHVQLHRLTWLGGGHSNDRTPILT